MDRKEPIRIRPSEKDQNKGQHMAQFDDKRSVSFIKSRMKGLGIDLDQYITKVVGVTKVSGITNVFDDPQVGFGFKPNDLNAYTALMLAITNSYPRFLRDNMVGGSQHHGASFRENSQPDSLHIILSRSPDPSMCRMCQVRPTCSIHLDFVSPVAGWDANTGRIKYDLGKLLQHLATDLKHTPLIVPSGQEGIVFGFRF
jgi:hypothetical protein